VVKFDRACRCAIPPSVLGDGRLYSRARHLRAGGGSPGSAPPVKLDQYQVPAIAFL